ncbi:MAG: DUF7151 family protein, partial [Myxococcota bacterium]
MSRLAPLSAGLAVVLCATPAKALTLDLLVDPDSRQHDFYYMDYDGVSGDGQAWDTFTCSSADLPKEFALDDYSEIQVHWAVEGGAIQVDANVEVEAEMWTSTSGDCSSGFSYSDDLRNGLWAEDYAFAGTDVPTVGHTFDDLLDTPLDGLLFEVTSETSATAFSFTGAWGSRPSRSGGSNNHTLCRCEVRFQRYVSSDDDPGQLATFVPIEEIVDVEPEPAGENCAQGGARIETGTDANADGALDGDEIETVSYSCDGATGEDGSTALVKVTDEPAGDNCTAGGQRIDSGLDDDDSGTLEDDEIDSTAWLCDGEDGLTGPQGPAGEDGADGQDALVAVTAEPAGDNCTAGGQRIDSGLDDDDSGTLEDDEIDSTSFVCDGQDGDVGRQGPAGEDGQDGLTALTEVSDEPAGDNCTAGGQRVDAGLDDDGSGTLEDDEIDSTSFVCDGQDGDVGRQGPAGEDGQDGLTALTEVSDEPAGDNCTA